MIDRIITYIGTFFLIIAVVAVPGLLEFGAGLPVVLVSAAIGALLISFESWRYGGITNVFR